MSVNKFQNGQLVKVSGGPANASEVYFKDDVSGLGVNNVKAAIDELNTNKVETGNVLNSLDAIDATTNANDVAGALAVKELNKSLVKLKMVKLWENPNPNIAFFPIDDLGIDTTDYDFIEVLCKWHITIPYCASSRVYKNQGIGIMSVIYTSGTSLRGCKLTNKILIQDGFNTTTNNTDNDRCIPLIIYGGKFS